MGWLVCAMRWQLLELGAVLNREAGVRVADGRPLWGRGTRSRRLVGTLDLVVLGYVHRHPIKLAFGVRFGGDSVPLPLRNPRAHPISDSGYPTKVNRTPFAGGVTPQKSIAQDGYPTQDMAYPT